MRRLLVVPCLAVALACEPPIEMTTGTGGGVGTAGGRAGGAAGTGGGTAGSGMGGGTAGSGMGGGTAGSGTGGGTAGSGMGGGTAGSGTGGGNAGGSGFDAGNSNCLGVLTTPARACSNFDVPGGLCRSDACVPCTGNGEDQACAVAYGGVTSAAFRCVLGQCVPGQCRIAQDCVGTQLDQICTAPGYRCEACTSDLECRTAYGAGRICNTTSGRCIPNTCGTAATTGTTTMVNTPCAAANPSDICCAAGASNGCVRGNCCTQAQCGAGQACIGNICTACTAPASGAICVDPVAGDDVAASGSGMPTGACCFKTLTRAVQFAIATDGGTPPRTISLRGDIPAVNGETFPLRLPAGVSVASDVAGTQRTVPGKAGVYSFEIAGQNSALTDLVIDGQGTSGGGVRVLPGTNFGLGNRLVNVAVRNTAGEGVRIEGGGIGMSGSSSDNASNGLRVLDGTAQLVPAAGQSVAFERNGGHGIMVDRIGAIVITGTPGPDAGFSGAGTVASNRNAGSGLYLTHQVGMATLFNRIDGLVATGNARDGVRATSNVAFSSFTRNVLLGNARNGFSVRIFEILPSGLLGLNLDGATNPNTLQSLSGENPNGGAGICFDPYTAGGRLTLDARRNRFAGRDCSVMVAPAPRLNRSLTCAGGADVGGVSPTDGGMPNLSVQLSGCEDI